MAHAEVQDQGQPQTDVTSSLALLSFFQDDQLEFAKWLDGSFPASRQANHEIQIKIV